MAWEMRDDFRDRNEVEKLVARAVKADGLEGRPDIFLQLKGTDICIDFWCECGLVGHYDGYFAYVLECAGCGKAFQVAPTLLVAPMIAENVGAATTVVRIEQEDVTGR